MTPGRRRTLYISDELYARIEKAAADAGAAQGKPMSVSEWVRVACEERLDAPANGQHGVKGG